MKVPTIRRPELSVPAAERAAAREAVAATATPSELRRQTPAGSSEHKPSVPIIPRGDVASVATQKEGNSKRKTGFNSSSSVVSAPFMTTPRVPHLNDDAGFAAAMKRESLGNTRRKPLASGSASVAAPSAVFTAPPKNPPPPPLPPITTTMQPTPITTVDEWLTTKKSLGEDTTGTGVIVIRGDGEDKLGELKDIGRKDGKKRKGVWESIFGGRGSEGSQENEDQAPRRSEPQSVVAPEEVDIPVSPSRGEISVMSSVTEGTFSTYGRTFGEVDYLTQSRAMRYQKHKLRTPIGRAKKASTSPSPAYMHPHKNSTPSRKFRPKLNTTPSNIDQYGRDDDDISVSSYSINSVDSKLFAPPAFRRQDVIKAGQGSDTSAPAADQADNSGLAEKWSLLGWVGGNGWDQMTNRKPTLDKVDRAKRSSLTQNLVDADSDEGIPSKVPSTDGFTSRVRHVVCNAQFLYAVMFAGMAAGLFYGVVSNSRLSYSLSDVDISIDWDEELNVAFIGNSYLFINDIPRVMEAISENHIHQESVIHSSGGSLGNLLLTGNGMYPRWRTGEAIVDRYVNEYGNNVTIYDYGLCSVAQILSGYDNILSYGNEDGAYYNDGKNPCIRNQNYFYYVQDKLANSSFAWDYVVLVDQTKRMAVEEARQQSIYALANAYGPLIESTGAIPVIVDTHAFWSSSTNMTGFVDIPTFQTLIYDGVLDYVSALAQVLPDWQSPVVAPIGLAYLVVYEENYYLWQKLFIDDDIHSSVHGSYLFACVLYATLYGHLPRKTTNTQLDAIFANSRLLVGQDIAYPSAQEAFYYRRVAKRVALDGYIPTSMSRR